MTRELGSPNMLFRLSALLRHLFKFRHTIAMFNGASSKIFYNLFLFSIRFSAKQEPGKNIKHLLSNIKSGYTLLFMAVKSPFNVNRPCGLKFQFETVRLEFRGSSLAASVHYQCSKFNGPITMVPMITNGNQQCEQVHHWHH